jgi:hypothetical protein
MDIMQLSMKPQMTALRYAKVRAYGNHYRVTTDNEGTSNNQQLNILAFTTHKINTSAP